MIKIFYLTIIAMMISVTAQAKLVEMESRFDTVHGYYNDAMKFTSAVLSFGKILFPGDYGVFISVRAPVDLPDDKRRTESFTFFFRPVDGEIERNGDSLYLVDADGTTKLAEKQFISWKTVPGVNLVKNVQEEWGRIVVDVSIQIDDRVTKIN